MEPSPRQGGTGCRPQGWAGRGRTPRDMAGSYPRLQFLRSALAEMCDCQGVDLHMAAPELCTDNAAMAALGWERLDAGHAAGLDIDVTPGLIRR